ncbi:MAG TPA: hypothetical protein VFF33_13585 [Ignavibacteriaceae bacterium]|nr:hypothetical protein [Ignavibacteriaceae bacterium]
MSTKNKIVSRSDTINLLHTSDEFAVINNPEVVYPDYELLPLAKKITKVPFLKAVVMDMDGTTTTTEELCIHSLEFMVQKITGLAELKLDHQKDYPHIIGNSTTKHVEYLIRTYQKYIVEAELRKSFIYAAVWTLLYSNDLGRVNEVKLNLINFNCKELILDNNLNENNISSLIKKYSSKVKITNIVRAAVDIYYQRYHEILMQIKSGNSKDISQKIFGNADVKLIEPMNGVAVFIALIKGWLGEEIKSLFYLFEDINEKQKENLLVLSKYFEANPVKLAIVTSSISYEADIVLGEVFTLLKEEASKWKISAKSKKNISNYFSHYLNTYDAYITASDSNEIRLKPHRDLYSIALHKLGINKKDFNKVLGLEDSESGTIAIRAAGIGLCVAVPFTKTSGHNFKAASYIASNGLSELILKKNLFMKVSF